MERARTLTPGEASARRARGSHGIGSDVYAGPMKTQMGFWVGLALGLAFSAGFAVASWAPRAEAQTAAGRWEYRTVHHGWDEGRWAQELGAQGWRFIGFEFGNPHILIFERPR